MQDKDLTPMNIDECLPHHNDRKLRALNINESGIYIVYANDYLRHIVWLGNCLTACLWVTGREDNNLKSLAVATFVRRILMSLSSTLYTNDHLRPIV